MLASFYNGTALALCQGCIILIMHSGRVTEKRSIAATVVDKILGVLHVKKWLVSNSYAQLKSYEDKRTPIRRGYEKLSFDGLDAFWINKKERSNGVLVYLPGGGFIIGPSRLHWDYCEKIGKELKLAVLLIRYGLGPEQPFPNGLDGIVAAIVELQQQGIIQRNWFMAGDSAGGNLTVAACYKLNEYKVLLPKKIMLFFPVLDMTVDDSDVEGQALNEKDHLLSPAFNRKVQEAYVRKNNPANAYLSPVYGDVSVLPPVLLQHGTDDILVRGSRVFVHKMQAAEKSVLYEEYAGMFHGFTLMRFLPEAKKAFQSQLAFIRN